MSTIEYQDAAISRAVNGIFVPGTVIADDRLQCLLLVCKLKEFDTKVDYKRWMFPGGIRLDEEKFMKHAIKVSGINSDIETVPPVKNYPVTLRDIYAYGGWASQ